MQKALDPDKKENILAILSVGGTRAMAASFVGCHPRTIYNEACRDKKCALSATACFQRDDGDR